CSRIGAMTSLMCQHPAETIPNPHPPGGDPDRRALLFEHGRSGHVLWLALRQLQLRSGRHLGRADGDEPGLPPGVGVAVALLVRSVETAREVIPERHRQLERLTAVAEVGLALPR